MDAAARLRSLNPAVLEFVPSSGDSAPATQTFAASPPHSVFTPMFSAPGGMGLQNSNDDVDEWRSVGNLLADDDAETSQLYANEPPATDYAPRKRLNSTMATYPVQPARGLGAVHARSLSAPAGDPMPLSPTTVSVDEQDDSEERKPACRYFLMGDCRIRNCQFRHVRDVVCKFWLRDGHCARGDQCMYLHEGAPPAPAPHDDHTFVVDGSPPSHVAVSEPTIVVHDGVANNSLLANNDGNAQQARSLASIWGTQGDRLSTSPNNTGSVFAGVPLGSASPPTEQFPSQPETWTLATRLKLRGLQEEFAHIPAAAVQRTFVAVGCRHTQARARLTVEWPSAPTLNNNNNNNDANNLHSSSNTTNNSFATNSYTANNHHSSSSTGASPWVATGSAVEATYLGERQAAIDAAVQRNRLFDMATHAYLRGDKLAAKQLSAEGRRHQQAMEALHADAASKIFRARNAESGLASVLDLHGLHPQEAVEVVTRHYHQVRATANNRQERTFSVITGSGHHSWHTDKPKVLPAVVEALTQLGCTYRDTSVDGRGGMLSVVVPKT